MIDWTRVSELREEIGPDDFEEVVTLFLEEVEDGIGALSGSAGDTLAARLHFLKGSALNLGFDDFAALCQDGERAAISGQVENVDLGAIIDTYRGSRQEFLGQLDRRLAP